MSDELQHRPRATLPLWRSLKIDRTGLRITLRLWGAALLLWAVVRIGGAAGLSVNLTPSMPIGLWIMRPLASKPARGLIVAICAEASSNWPAAEGQRSCPGGHPLLLKPIAAVPGDHVWMSHAGLSVNGVFLPGSRALPVSGVPAAPSGHYTVAKGDVWVIATRHPRSYDSRYLGALPIANIRGIALPVLVWR